MKSYQFFTKDGRGGTMLCDDDSLEEAVQELTQRFGGVVKVQYGTEVWTVDAESQTLTATPATTTTSSATTSATTTSPEAAATDSP